MRLTSALVVAPADALQGDVYRIIYYHVPSAWTAFLLFFINFIASIQYLVSGKPSARSVTKWIVIAIGVIGVIATYLPPIKAQIPAGMEPSAVATTVSDDPGILFSDRMAVPRAEARCSGSDIGRGGCGFLHDRARSRARSGRGRCGVSGGRSGDIRLTSTLVMWLIYVSYLVLRRFSNSAQTQILAAALAVFGALDVPLVYLSIWFFRTQHPQPVIGGGGSMDPRMLQTLLLSWMAFLCFAFPGVLVAFPPRIDAA